MLPELLLTDAHSQNPLKKPRTEYYYVYAIKLSTVKAAVFIFHLIYSAIALLQFVSAAVY